jgi:hypothetical protein
MKPSARIAEPYLPYLSGVLVIGTEAGRNEICRFVPCSETIASRRNPATERILHFRHGTSVCSAGDRPGERCSADRRWSASHASRRVLQKNPASLLYKYVQFSVHNKQSRPPPRRPCKDHFENLVMGADHRTPVRRWRSGCMCRDKL